ncbi:MAG: penicillin-binding transpeptidase domain-containing protein, partial [Planctomycetota bacterium]
MYNRRVKALVICISLLLLAFLLRLGRMQLQPHSFYQDKIAELKLRKGRQRQFKTVRGRILDRTGRILAADEPRFQLHVDYQLISLTDQRVTRAKLLRAAQSSVRSDLLSQVQDEMQAGLDLLKQIIQRCAARFGLQHEDVQNRIDRANDRIWNLRTFLAWVRSDPDPKILAKYANNVNRVPLSEAIASFEKKFPSENERLLRIARVRNIADMDKTWPLLDLKNDDEIFAAQLEFLDANGVQILPDAQRAYPYGSVAAQTIGWVGRAQEQDKERFARDRLSSYLSDEVCGREGIEYVCEDVLRGRRGEVVLDIDKQLIRRTETEFGEDISLTLDIELQKEIEDYLADCQYNPNCKRPTAAVVIEVATGDILALVSTPVFDLNRARYDYDDIVAHPNEPFRNRAICKQYPPGSVIKPLILIAGLESGKITPLEVISCPARKAPDGWPSCWLFNKYKWLGHDDKWQNHARNAIRGSCNIYFSRLADRIDPDVLQQWFFRFGYGREFPLPPASFFAYHRSRNRTLPANSPARNLRQAP